MTLADRSCLPVPGPERPFRFPDIVRHTLDNGLRVMTVQHHRVPLVCVLLLVPAGHAANPSLYKSLPYDQSRDLAPVSQLTSGPLVLVVYPSLPVRSINTARKQVWPLA